MRQVDKKKGHLGRAEDGTLLVLATICDHCPQLHKSTAARSGARAALHSYESQLQFFWNISRHCRSRSKLMSDEFLLDELCELEAQHASRTRHLR